MQQDWLLCVAYISVVRDEEEERERHDGYVFVRGQWC